MVAMEVPGSPPQMQDPIEVDHFSACSAGYQQPQYTPPQQQQQSSSSSASPWLYGGAGLLGGLLVGDMIGNADNNNGGGCGGGGCGGGGCGGAITFPRFPADVLQTCTD